MDELTGLLLSQLAGGRGSLSVADVIAQTMSDDPVAASLVAALRQRESADEDETDPEAAEEIERLQARIDALEELRATLADALGACRRCFGEDELCAVCHGHGRPGGRQPDPVLCEELVGPAWRRHVATVAAFGDDLHDAGNQRP